MDDFAKGIFNTAVIREKAANRMYSELADTSTDPAIKELFQKLADEELVHASLFKKMDLDILKKVNSQDMNKLKIRFTGDKDINFEEKREINKILDFAINEEQKAYDDYTLLLNHLPFGEAKDTLKEVATQEARHKTILQKVKLEFNEKDWKVI